MAQWIVTWGLLGVVTGFGLTFGDTGHLPASWIMIIVPVSGMVAGLITGVGFSWALYLLPVKMSSNPISRIVVGVIVGAISVFLLGWFVLGVQWGYTLIWGASAGILSVGIELRTKAEIAEK